MSDAGRCGIRDGATQTENSDVTFLRESNVNKMDIRMFQFGSHTQSQELVDGRVENARDDRTEDFERA